MPTEKDKIININLDLTETNIFKNATYESNETFWTTDVNSAYLEFTTTNDLTDSTASLVLKNVDDGSLIQRNIETSESPFLYKLREQEIIRAGRWYGQIVLESDGKSLTAAVFRFKIKGSLLDSSSPALVDIDNYRKLSDQLTTLYDQMNTYLTNVAIAEEARESAEAFRRTLFEESQRAREVVFEESQQIRQEAFEQLIEDTQTDVTAIKDESKKTIDTMITAGSSEIKQDKDSAKQSAETAQQAMTDFLAMLGVDIATLGADGKLSPNQIPALAINDTFTVSTVEEITELDAQRGDVAIHIIETNVSDAYILSTDTPTVLDNWIKLGISYVAKAGHAETATSAVNAEKINNHRLVTMTQAEYDLSAKDPNTVYLVEG